MDHCILWLFFVSAGLFGCEHDVGPCWWDGSQDRETGMVQATSLDCDGVAVVPATLHVMYHPASPPLTIEIDAVQFRASLFFDPELPDGTYPVASDTGTARGDVLGSGADVTGTLTFVRSRDVPFVDIPNPDARVYESTMDAEFDLVAVLPHPDPAMGSGCRLETGAQRVSLVVSGPVVECTARPTTGVH